MKSQKLCRKINKKAKQIYYTCFDTLSVNGPSGVTWLECCDFFTFSMHAVFPFRFLGFVIDFFSSEQ